MLHFFIDFFSFSVVYTLWQPKCLRFLICKFNWMQSSEKLNLIPESSRITGKEYNEIVNTGEPHVLVDVRPVHHFKIAAIPRSMNIPLSNLEGKLSTIHSALKQAAQDSGKCASLFVVCRRGNDSQRAVDYLSKNGFPSAKDIVGGLQSWSQDVDHTFPSY